MEVEISDAYTARRLIKWGEVDQKTRKWGGVYGSLQNMFLKLLAQPCSRVDSMLLDLQPWGMKRGDIWALLER